MSALPLAPDLTVLAAMPFRDFVELGAVETAPGCARKRAATVLAQWGLESMEYPVGMIISELVTNSVMATREEKWAAEVPPVRLWMRADPSLGVYVLVHDALPCGPVPRDASEVDEFDESGRGLAMIVPLFSAECGWHPAEGGKVAWALVAPPCHQITRQVEETIPAERMRHG